MKFLWLPLLGLLGCRDYKGTELADVIVEDAWIEDLGYGGVLIVGGGWSGNGTLVVVDPQRQRHELPVRLAGGGMGLALSMSASVAPVDVELELPRTQIRGNQLLGKYSGSAEALAVLFGAQVHHLRNRDEVQMDFATVTFGLSVLVAGHWATLLPREDEGDTGDTGDSDDTGWAWVPPDTPPIETGDSGAAGTTTSTTGTGDTGP